MKLDIIMTNHRTQDWEVSLLIGPILLWANRWDRRLSRWVRGKKVWKDDSDVYRALESQINSLKVDGWI